MQQLFGETTHGKYWNTPNKLRYRERVDDAPVLKDFTTALPAENIKADKE